MAKIIGIKKRIGFNYKGRGRFLTDKIDITGYNDKHAIEYYLDLLRFLDITPKRKDLDLKIPGSLRAQAKDMLSKVGVKEEDLLVGIAPGAGGSWGKDAVYRHWPALKFAQIADRLVERFKARILLLGDESDKHLAGVITNAMRSKPIDFTGKIGLNLLPAIINNCGLFISNDGGPMHIAVGLGVKTVTVMGPVDEKVYGPFPLDNNHKVLAWQGECRPCYKNFRLPECKRDRECLKGISVDEVYEAVVKILSERVI